ncbi:MAG: hypothetical protein K8J08_08605 [Thermoanaerobaculia bacterium]|nr:hypothetical protein [Thermoanaerobaculia bacterium]
MPGLSTHRRNLVLALAILIAVAVLIGLSISQSSGGDSQDFAGAAPDWIWDPEWPSMPAARAHAFAVERTVTVPAVVPASARLLIQADEEYHLSINGQWVGAGRYRDGTRWDAYPISSLVRPGENQLRVELRSSRGVGGLLLCLQAEAGAPCWLRSNELWKVVPADRSPSRSAKAWGQAPVGKWPLPTGILERGLASVCIDTAHPATPRRIVALDPLTRGEGEDEVSLPVWSLRWGPRARAILELDLDPAVRHLGELSFGHNRRLPVDRTSRETVITEPGQSTFRSVTGRELRIAEVDGIAEVLGGRYYRVRDECDDWMFELPPPTEGLLGLPPPPSRTPVQDELWGDL